MKNKKTSIENITGSYTITIPSKTSWYTVLFGTAWLSIWAIAIINVMDAFNTTGTEGEVFAGGFLSFWLIGWSLGAIIMAYLLLWTFFGKEKLSFTDQYIFFQKTLFGIGSKHLLPKNEVKNLHFNDISTCMFTGSLLASWGLGSGKVKFDSGLRTYSFGLGVDDTEANYLVDELNDRIS